MNSLFSGGENIMWFQPLIMGPYRAKHSVILQSPLFQLKGPICVRVVVALQQQFQVFLNYHRNKETRKQLLDETQESRVPRREERQFQVFPDRKESKLSLDFVFTAVTGNEALSTIYNISTIDGVCDLLGMN